MQQTMQNETEAEIDKIFNMEKEKNNHVAEMENLRRVARRLPQLKERLKTQDCAFSNLHSQYAYSRSVCIASKRSCGL